MSELLKSKRVVFPYGKQREFLFRMQNNLGLDSKALAELTGTGVRNLSTWRTEKGRMSFYAVEQLCKKAKIPLPSDIEVKEVYWHTQEAGKKGGKALYKKYGRVAPDEAHRKRKWKEWWEREGKYKELSITQPLPFQKPRLSGELAEFIGILLGDGGISNYQITVTLHRVTDGAYSVYVRKLIKKLFGIEAGKYESPNYLADDIVISRVGLVQHLTQEIGLVKGNKITHQVSIPDWIMNNKKFQKACMRGLMDTDGGIVIHRYRSQGKMYRYKKLSFTSRSRPLLLAASQVLANWEIQHRITKNGCDIRIESQEAVKKYFSVIGSSNPKHLERYKV